MCLPANMDRLRKASLSLLQKVGCHAYRQGLPYFCVKNCSKSIQMLRRRCTYKLLFFDTLYSEQNQIYLFIHIKREITTIFLYPLSQVVPYESVKFDKIQFRRSGGKVPT